jgi:hypothetical protein
MSKRSESFDLTTTTPGMVIEVKVRYSKSDMIGGENQGYWLNITPVKIDGSFRVTTAYTGLKRFMEGAKRFSAKKLETLAIHVKHEIMTGHTEDSLVQMALRVADDSNLTINQWSPGKE